MKKMFRISLFLLALACYTAAFAQHKTIQDILNRFSTLTMCHINTSSFLAKYHEYNLVKNEKFLDKITLNHQASERLAKEIARNISKRDGWPAWIKNGVKPEDEKYFTQLVGVVVPKVYTSNETLIAYVPELNENMPEPYRLKEPFYVLAPSKYYYDVFIPGHTDSTTVSSANVARWVREFNNTKKGRPIVLDAKQNPMYSYGGYNKTSDGYDLFSSRLTYIDAAMISKNTSANVEWIMAASYAMSLPEGLAYLSQEETKTINAYIINSEIKGYTYTLDSDEFKVMKTYYIRIPEAENRHLIEKVSWAPNRDAFFKFTVHLPPSHPMLKGDLFDSTKFKKFKNKYTEYLLPSSREGKIAELLRDYLNGFANIGKGNQPVETGTATVRKVYWANQLSDFDRDVVTNLHASKKVVYASYLTPQGEKAWTYDQCKQYSDDMYYLLTKNNFFWGMEGFSSLRSPKVTYGYESENTGELATKIGYFMTEYQIAGTTQYDNNYEYDEELAYKYTYSLRIRVSIREDETAKGRFYVFFTLFDNK
ncbi:MAG: hypothetical protein GXC72_01320 [Chitinophagaceae bacterium]|nr:hypothetical protein [Chitinophagaceae bacterium]